MSNEVITTDIYKIADATNQLQKRFMSDVNEDTLVMGMYGYLNEKLSDNLQRAIIMAGQWGNEAFPIKAKFDKTILTDAITYDISNINAVPAQMNIMLGFIEKELDNQMKNDKFIISKGTPIMIGKFEFHLDYDIIINREKLANKGYIYTTQYNIEHENPLSDITNPFLEPPFNLIVNNDNFIFIYCKIRQVKIDKIYKKIISNNILENKTVDFEFKEQLASFDVKVIHSDNSVSYLKPIYDGMPLTNELFCYYNYLDTNTIRIKFNHDSYDPELNSTIEIDVYYTDGKAGNFMYSDDCSVSINSDTKQNIISALVKPIKGSTNGLDKKSIDEIKQIIPKEILSRKNIINDKDLENFFNSIDSDNRMIFYKRMDNQQTRLYYGYLIAKDDDNNVIPTNTIDILINEKEFSCEEHGRYIIKPGSTIIYKKGEYGRIADKNTTILKDDFVYSTPFTIVLNKNPLSISYYLDIINMNYNLKFEYINQNSFVHFITTYLKCHRNYLDNNKYVFNINITQNVNTDENLVNYDEKGNIIDYNIKVAMVFKIDNIHTYYVFGKIINFNPNTFSYDVSFEIESDTIINEDNKIKINNMYIAGTDNIGNMYIGEKGNVSIYIYGKFDKEYGRYDNNTVIPNMDGYTLCDIYNTTTSIDLFYNYSNTIKSTASLYGSYDEKYGQTFKIKGVPLIRKSYIEDVDRCDNCIEYIQYRKLFIDTALEVIENSFAIDLKFFNTYGPSEIFKIGYDGQALDKTNLTLTFIVKLKPGAEKYVIDKIKSSIKTYVEDINTIKDNIHMSNLTTTINDEYKSEIYFIEFVGINNYDALLSYIQKQDNNEIERVPEFLNINLLNDQTPDINIILK